MFKKILGLIAGMFAMALLFSCASAPIHGGPGTIAEGELLGRRVTAKIDLPLRAGMVVYSNGEIDFAVYRSKLEALGPSIRRYESAQITKIQVESDQIKVKLNWGGQGGLAHKGHLKWIQPDQLNAHGTTVHIKFDHSPTEGDLRPERVAYALRDVLEIRGISALSEPAPQTAAMPPAISLGAKLLSVEAHPSRVMKGQQLNLTVHFEVEGATSERPLGLIINRQIYRGDRTLFSAPRTQQGHWASGIHSAHFAITVPSTTEPGVYRFRAWISHGGKEESREALFEVLAGGG